jgi:hypothetical protein
MHPYLMQEIARQRLGNCAGQQGNTARLSAAATAR